jgi:hypothetical protein
MSEPENPFQILIDAATADPDPSGKPWWQSRSIWGVLIVIGAQGLALAGIEVDQTAALEAAMGLVTILGALLAWVGRVRATRPISMRRVLPGVTLSEKAPQP